MQFSPVLLTFFMFFYKKKILTFLVATFVSFWHFALNENLEQNIRSWIQHIFYLLR